MLRVIVSDEQHRKNMATLNELTTRSIVLRDMVRKEDDPDELDFLRGLIEEMEEQLDLLHEKDTGLQLRT